MNLFETIENNTTEVKTAPETAQAPKLEMRIYQGRDGWAGITNTTKSGEGWQITTSKRHGGKIESVARKGDFSNGSFSFMMFGGKSLNLGTVEAKATEKSITEAHTNALKVFTEMTANEPAPYIIPIGQKLICYGYAMNIESNNWVVYEIVNSVQVKAIDVDSLQLHTFERVRDIAEKFGIGTYYQKGDVYSDLNNLPNLVQQAEQKQAEERQKLDELIEATKTERARKIEEGKKIVSVPSDAVAVIVAELMEDQSDPMTDYFHSSVTKTIYLAFSKHKRDIFPEMRKAVLNCDIPEIRIFAEAPTVNTNNETRADYYAKNLEYFKDKPNAEQLAEKETAQYWHPSDEHREKYSMGAGFYLGEKYSRSGWRICKRGFNPQNLDEFYVAASDGLFYANAEPEPEKTNFEAVPVEAGTVQIIEYSEKSFAVIGDTKPIKDTLKDLGGRFNFRLTCGAGWIFPNSKLEEVQTVLLNQTAQV
ncbi:hypothetical protein [Flavobacterium mekongense]|uniref:hypothetical protein n=1 Tax=Flavobacterium mekongense TaxID=3379707 RepID=UPI00399BC684